MVCLALLVLVVHVVCVSIVYTLIDSQLCMMCLIITVFTKLIIVNFCRLILWYSVCDVAAIMNKNSRRFTTVCMCI